MSNTTSDISKFFVPKSIAVVGASRKAGKIGHELLRNIKLSGYEGQVFPINPHADSILGYKVYRSLDDLEERQIDLAVLAVPAEATEEVMDNCARKRVPAVIIISSGFSETGNAELEQRIVAKAKESNMRIIGPNTFGIFYAKSKMNATFGPNYVLSGKTAFITQSGALGLALMDWTTEERYGVSAIVSIGNKADVDDADLLEFFANEDESTASILIYMEGLKNGGKFYNAAKKAVQKKPVIVIKSGSSKRGAQAASSHTGSIAGQDIIFSTVFREAGVLRAKSMTQAFDWIQAINQNPVPEGDNIVIITNGGGIGVLATDECEDHGLNLMDIPEDLKEEIKSVIPDFGSLKNPIDMTANANDEIYGKVLETLMKRSDVDAIIALFCQTANIDPSLVAEALLRASGVETSSGKKKAITAAFVGGHQAQLAYARLVEKKVAAYPTAERAVDGMSALIERYRQIKRRNISRKTAYREPQNRLSSLSELSRH